MLISWRSAEALSSVELFEVAAAAQIQADLVNMEVNRARERKRWRHLRSGCYRGSDPPVARYLPARLLQECPAAAGTHPRRAPSSQQRPLGAPASCTGPPGAVRYGRPCVPVVGAPASYRRAPGAAVRCLRLQCSCSGRIGQPRHAPGAVRCVRPWCLAGAPVMS